MPQEEVRVYYRRKKKRTPPVEGGGDGIDVLPDEVLQHVLSFLPSREAVQTCVLARRWRHLWKSVPALRIPDVTENVELTKQEFSSLERFMNNLLLFRDHKAPLDLFDFFIKPLDYDQDIPQCMSWIQQALQCKCQFVRMKYHDDQAPLALRNRPLISQHLTTLEFDYVTLGRKTLDFSNCLVLKNLLLRGCCIASSKMFSPSLERLNMIFCTFEYSGLESRTHISAPRLIQLELTDNHNTPLLGKMPSLVHAFVRLYDSEDVCGQEEFGGSCDSYNCDNCRESGDVNRGCVLFKGLSQAESLELVAEPGQYIFKRDMMWCPVFSKLKILLLNEWCVAISFCPLICFLQHAPVLEKLILQLHKAPKNWVEAKESYNPLKPSFPSNKLKVVEIECEEFDERVHKIFRILRSHCVYIEQINVHRSW